MREALKYMENCLAAESALERARTELAQGRAELAALREPLAALLASLSRDPLQDADAAPDWLSSLDAALASAESMAQAQDERARLSGLLAEEEDDVRAGEAALGEARNNERNLLALAGARDAEDFLRLAALRDEQRDLARRRQDLEDALRLAADTLPLPEFLASFRARGTGEPGKTQRRHSGRTQRHPGRGTGAGHRRGRSERQGYGPGPDRRSGGTAPAGSAAAGKHGAYGSGLEPSGPGPRNPAQRQAHF